MKIAVILEGKNPPDKRVPLTPLQCKEIKEDYPEVEIVVQRSKVRAIKEEEYLNCGIEVVDKVEDADVLFGVKEVNKSDLLADKTYFFFSHTIKEQPYNKELLQEILKKNIKLVDYECLTNSKGKRLVGFGRYAGIVGCYNTFLAYGLQSEDYELKAANKCVDRKEMEAELPKVKLPNDFKIVISGFGRVAGGAIEILSKLGIKQVESNEFLNTEYGQPVFTQLSVSDYFVHPEKGRVKRSEIYEDPSKLVSDFMRFAAISDMYIPCHYWDSRSPFIFSREDMAKDSFKIRTIGDISCDIDGPVASTIRPSTIADPIYVLDRKNCVEVSDSTKETITVMAVDNLPCELPIDASEDFGSELLSNIIPCLLRNDEHKVIDRASIAENGALTKYYEHLKNYVES